MQQRVNLFRLKKPRPIQQDKCDRSDFIMYVTSIISTYIILAVSAVLLVSNLVCNSKYYILPFFLLDKQDLF